MTEENAQEVAQLVRTGGVYVKPERMFCKYGHSLKDAYRYGKTVLCKKCIKIRCAEYFKRTYLPRLRKEILICPRGHDKRITKTKHGDCSECIKIRSQEQKNVRN